MPTRRALSVRDSRARVDSVKSVSVEDGHLYKKAPSFVPRVRAEAPPTVCAKARFLNCVAPGVTDDHDSVR